MQIAQDQYFSTIPCGRIALELKYNLSQMVFEIHFESIVDSESPAHKGAKLYSPGRPSKRPPPNKPGIYRWRNKKTDTIDYIGETNDLQRRMLEHERSDKPVNRQTHDFEWKQADGRFSYEKRREHERDKIAQKQPPLNRVGGGGGRKPIRSPHLQYNQFHLLLNEAMSHIGKPYKGSADGPDKFDCSRFVGWVFRKSGVYDIPKECKRACHLYEIFTKIKPTEKKQKGDLLFFGKCNDSEKITHVGIYIGRNMLIHATGHLKSSRSVCIENIKELLDNRNYCLIGLGRLPQNT